VDDGEGTSNGSSLVSLSLSGLDSKKIELMKAIRLESKLSRRSFNRLSTLFLASLTLPSLACKRLERQEGPFQRKAMVFRLGESADFLYKKVFVTDKKFLVHRLEKGWGAVSTRCTHLGCDLSYQDKYLLCPCCGSAFDHFGKLLRSCAVLLRSGSHGLN